MIKQIIFDCDGVLVDTEIVAARIVIDLLKTQGVSLPLDEYIRAYTGKSFSSVFTSLLNTPDNEKLVALVEDAEHKTYEQLTVIDGIPEMVKTLDFPKSVVSNSALWQIDKALTFTGLNTHFHHIFSAEMVERPKPFPDVYLLAAQTLGVQPFECLVIEDSSNGVTAAVQAGMQVIGFTGASHITPGHDERLKEKEQLTRLKILLNCSNIFLRQ